MPSEFTSPQPEQLTPERPSLEAIANGLLSNREINALPEDQQGTVIVDRFIGALVRQGVVEGSGATYNAADTLALIDNISKVGEPGVDTLTRKNGLRKAVIGLASDARVGSMIGSLSSRLESVDDGKGDEAFTLTSAAQIEGYLLAGGKENTVENPGWGIHMSGDSWIPVILEQVQRMSKDPHMTWMTTRDAQELTKSSAPLIRNSGLDWGKATRSAEATGVDMNIIRRSAEKIQERTKDQHDLGATALFVATEGRITNYKADLDRRSGY